MGAMVPIPIFPALPGPKLPRVPASLRSEAKSSQGPEHGFQHPQSQVHRQPLPGDQPGGGATGDGDTGQGRDAGQASQVAEGGRQGPGGGPGPDVWGAGVARAELSPLSPPLRSVPCRPQPSLGKGSLYPRPAPPWATCTHGFHHDIPPLPLPWPPLLILGVATPGAPPGTPCLAQSSCRPGHPLGSWDFRGLSPLKVSSSFVPESEARSLPPARTPAQALCPCRPAPSPAASRFPGLPASCAHGALSRELCPNLSALDTCCGSLGP